MGLSDGSRRVVLAVRRFIACLVRGWQMDWTVAIDYGWMGSIDDRQSLGCGREDRHTGRLGVNARIGLPTTLWDRE